MTRRGRDLSQVKLVFPDTFVPGPGGGGLGGGLDLRRAFTVVIDDPECPYRLAMTVDAREHQLVCVGLELASGEDGPPVTSTMIRVLSVESYLRLVRKKLRSAAGAFLIGKVSVLDSGDMAFDFPPTPGEWKGLESAHRQRRHTADLLPIVAEAYRKALGDYDPDEDGGPTAAVARRLGYSRGHVSRLVTEARKQGLLGPAHPGRAGEINPAAQAARQRKDRR